MRESIQKRQNNFEQMRAIADVYISSQECSVQKAVYHCLPELLIRKVFPGVISTNANLPERRFKLPQSKEKINSLWDDSKEVFKKICQIGIRMGLVNLFIMVPFLDLILFAMLIFKVLLSSKETRRQWFATGGAYWW